MRNRCEVMLCAGLGRRGPAVSAIAVSGGRVQADDPDNAPNAYTSSTIGRSFRKPALGMAIGVDIDRDGTSVWGVRPLRRQDLRGSNIAPIQKFDASGRLVVAFRLRPVQLAARLVCSHPTHALGHRRPQSRLSCN